MGFGVRRNNERAIEVMVTGRHAGFVVKAMHSDLGIVSRVISD